MGDTESVVGCETPLFFVSKVVGNFITGSSESVDCD